uniref:Uncharacterized protein n=1 Tax=viral metagenome TaxID=1070528 RepID=A0A6M3LP87_9ZZZZ
MKAYTVSLTLSVLADDENEAWAEFVQCIRHEQYDLESIDIEREPEADTDDD